MNDDDDDEDDKESFLTTSSSSTTTAATPVGPVISITEGHHKHMHDQHDHEHPHDHSTHEHSEHDHSQHTNIEIVDHNENTEQSPMTSSQSSTTTTEKSHDMPPAVYVFNGEGRSIDSSISAEDDDNLNYHYNFVTTPRNHDEHGEHKNSAFKDLSDISMEDDDDDDNAQRNLHKTHEHLHEHSGHQHDHFAIHENTKEEMTTTTSTTSAPNVSDATTTENLAEPQMKITEITAAGDTMHRECMADGKSYKVS